MINDVAKSCYYFAVKNVLELDSLGQLKGRKEAIINGDSNFQKALDDALSYQSIKTQPERISAIKPYINNHNWEEIEFPAVPKDWKKFKQNNKTIALNVLFVPYNTETIRVACRSENNNKREKQVKLLMITDGNRWHDLAITDLSALF